MASMECVPPRRGAIPAVAAQSAVVGAMAGDVRARLFGARIPSGLRWLPYDSLEILPYLVEAEPSVAAVVVDLVRWAPMKAAFSLRALRRMQADLRIVCLYEPGPETLAQLKDLVELDLDLAYAVTADERFDLLVKPVSRLRAFEEPTASRLLVQSLVPLAPNARLEAMLVHLALAPSLRQTVPALARIAGCSVDGLERRFADAGLGTPATIRGLAVDAEGLWQVAALNHSARDAARAVGLATGDSLGRMLKRRFGFGLRMARLAGAQGARQTLRWLGLLGLRALASDGGLPALAKARLTRRGEVHAASEGTVTITGGVRGAEVRLDSVGRALWDLVAGGTSLAVVVEQFCSVAQADRVPNDVAPGLRALLRHELVALDWHT